MSNTSQFQTSGVKRYADSFNRTYNAVNNLSDVGNTTISLGDNGEDALIAKALPYSLAALGVIVAAIVVPALFGKGAS